MTRIALRYLWARKLRTFLTSLSIVLGVMMVTGTYVFTDTIESSFDDIFTESNENIDAVVTAKETVESDDDTAPAFDAKLLDEVRKVDGIELAEGAIADPQVAIIGTDGEPTGTPGAPNFAFSAGSDLFDPLDYEGRPPEADDEIVIDRQTSESQGYGIGDMVEVAGKEEASEYTVVGIGTLGEVDSFGGASFAVLTLPEAQRIAGKEGRFDQIAVAAEDGVSPDELVREIALKLPASVTVETSAENVESQREDIAELIGFLTTALLIFAGVALFVATFLIFNTFSITVAQRTREFGMLRALGANRRQIVASVVLEALVLGLAASVLGFALGVLFADVLEAAFKGLGIDLPASGRVLEARTVIVAIAVGTLLTLVAALAPAVRATRVPPVAALREGVSLETPSGSRRRVAIAILLVVLGVAALVLGLAETLEPPGVWVGIGAAAMFIGVALLSPQLVRPMASLVGRPLERLRGVPGRLARENSVRNPGRTAATAAALMVGLALVAFVSVFAAGLRGSIDDAIDEVFASDLILAHTDGFSDIPLDAGEAAAEVEGVQTVSPYRFTSAIVDGDPDERSLSLVDPGTVGEVLELEWVDGSPELLSGLGPEDAVVDESRAKKDGLAVGEKFTARTASGEEIAYTVRGTYKDNADFTGDFVASDVNAAAYNEERSVTNFFIDLSPDADASAVREELEGRLGAGFPTLEVQDQEELKDSIAEELNALLGAVYALLALAIIVSLFGIVNTLALSIYERTRELGLLRAVGMSRRQVRRVIRYEAVITALIGAVLGTVLGVVFAVIASRPLAEEGFTLTIPFGTLVMLLVLAVIAGIVAAIGPARRASRLDVLEALAYE
ncbi:MAG TPA: FtsX-like permease family protein [Solirubrobacterales bacterium]